MQSITVAHVPTTREERKRMSESFTLRMLGEDVTFTGWQWLDLLTDLHPESPLVERIRTMLQQ
jgi:hypothetical protein